MMSLKERFSTKMRIKSFLLTVRGTDLAELSVSAIVCGEKLVF